eukprot:TRINITY_DN61025_c0_g1_i1.p1 TRINITY_DN61025_c0_g1~~TRINITY_DN61025_c0_g1_i1.p1  ORF type:complete len:495 (+),score=56.24 TRINITY_DN61025_c0_g1_i1:35-1486(+)
MRSRNTSKSLIGQTVPEQTTPKSQDSSSGNGWSNRSDGGIKLASAAAVVGVAAAALVSFTTDGQDSEVQKLNATGPVELRAEPLFPGGNPVRGLFATARIEKDKTIFTLPYRNCITEHNIQPKVADICQKYAKECEGRTPLILGMVLERRAPRPQHEAYIKGIPVAATNFMSFGPELQALVEKWKPFWATQLYAKVESVVNIGKSLEPPISKEEAIWAISAVAARAFLINGQFTMMPVFDLANHGGLKANMNFPRCNENLCWCTAARTISHGEQVFDSYGIQDNFYYFAKYGFVIPGNMMGPRISPQSNEFKLTSLAHKPWLQGFCAWGEAPDRLFYFMWRYGPALWGAPTVTTNGTLHDVELRCLFANLAFNTRAAFEKAIRSRAEQLENCFPLLQNSASSCLVPEWKRVTALIHKTLAKECTELDEWESTKEALPAAEASRAAGSAAAADVLDALYLQHDLVAGCALHHGQAADAWRTGKH